MEIKFTPKALTHLNEWKKSGNVGVQKKIEELLQSISDTPFSGVGKPEALKHNLSGKWSRRISYGDRIVYDLDGNTINIYSLKGHY